MNDVKSLLSQAAAILGRRAGVKRTPAQTAARRVNMAKAREYLILRRKPVSP